MSKREKLRQKLRQHPADSTMQDVQTILERFGFKLARVRGSHHLFEFDDGQRFSQIVVPLHGRKVKKLYVQKVVNSLDELFPPEAETDRGDDDD